MNILQATKSYEDWMRTCTTLVESQLRDKHARMKQDLFVFFRGTFYRWIQLWPKVGGDLRTAPEVLAVGDLHIDSFGTWRDTEGRLAWGVDDFDESYPMSYTNDLVRLAASVKIAIDSETLAIGLKEACEVILNGYRDTLKNEGCPFVLAEQEQNLEKLGVREIVPPKDFWRRLNERPAIRQAIPRAAKEALEAKLPKGLDYRVIRREAGTGSLGRQRFVAIGKWEGGYIAREAKAVTPSACAWLDGRKSSLRSYYEDAIEAAVRSRDPFQKIIKGWLIRRLSPDSNPIEITDWPAKRDEQALLHAMGCEAANIHLGTTGQIRKVSNDLQRRKSPWLRSAAKQMAKALEADWRDYKQSRR
ncbi:MAG: DUF2252 family protein [Candidatus Binataceae bacterium]